MPPSLNIKQSRPFRLKRLEESWRLASIAYMLPDAGFLNSNLPRVLA